MAYKLAFTDKANKQFKRLGKPVQKRIQAYLDEVTTLDNPRSRGKILTGNWAGMWRYRVGSYRVICDIKDEELTIVAIKIGHRREVYDWKIHGKRKFFFKKNLVHRGFFLS